MKQSSPAWKHSNQRIIPSKTHDMAPFLPVFFLCQVTPNVARISTRGLRVKRVNEPLNKPHCHIKSLLLQIPEILGKII